jgi:hypothetical protein
MKAVFGWLSDPYLHVLAIGLVLVYLVIGLGGGEPAAGSPSPTQHLPGCSKAHDTKDMCQPTVADSGRIVELR